MKEKTKVKRMYILDGGSFLYNTGMMLFGKDMEIPKRIMVPFFALDTEEGWVLYDTGFSPEAEPRLDSMGLKPQMSEANLVTGQLKKIGVAPEDVTMVIISHLHVDHVGGIQFFPDAEIYVQKDEFAFAKFPNAFHADIYDRRIFNLPNTRWKLLAGDGVIFPGLSVMLANGHTPGLQGLIIELPESGYYLLGANSAYLMENIEKSHPPGNVWNTVLVEYSIKRFKTLQAILGGRFLPGHDYDFYHDEINLGEAYI